MTDIFDSAFEPHPFLKSSEDQLSYTQTPSIKTSTRTKIQPS